MPSINGAEYLVILVVALLVFGPHRLPELTRKLSGWIREVRKVAQDFRTALESEVGDLTQPLEDLKAPIKELEKPLRDVTKPISPGGPTDGAAESTPPELAATAEEAPPAEPEAEAEPPAAGMLEWKGPVHSSGPTPDDARADFAALAEEQAEDEAGQ
ncbi:MAG: twin-arginine translocase TatA/TatE family subunit [Acidimicrobiia bacterium]|nr:MAG: twin-arginine translocase TatA/TatE family subunit [Acidimicrobiia bacterium]